MKTLTTTLLLLAMGLSVFAQDLIVTTQGDSLNCKITKIKEEYLYFSFMHKGEMRSTLLPLSQVTTYQQNYFTVSEVAVERIPNYNEHGNWSLALHGGYSYRLGAIGDVDQGLREYLMQLKSGFCLGTNLYYYPIEEVGFGLKGSLHRAKASGYAYVLTPGGSYKYSDVSDNISIWFIGPSLGLRYFRPNNEDSWIVNCALGYVNYTDHLVADGSYTLTGHTVGLNSEIFYDMQFANKTGLQIGISTYLANLFKYRLDDGNTIETIELQEEEYESLTRIDLTIGLRF